MAERVYRRRSRIDADGHRGADPPHSARAAASAASPCGHRGDLSKLHPTLPQVACFDTSFHHTQPEVAAAFALPRRLTDEGVRRYGFHGLSYEYIASVLPEIVGSPGAEGRVVVAHLGSGASMCAMKQRKSVATTMGFTALDGLLMSRRCGSLDPGVVLYLMEAEGHDGSRPSATCCTSRPACSAFPASATT